MNVCFLFFFPQEYGRKKPSHQDEKLHAVTADTWRDVCPPLGPWLCVIGVDIDSVHLPLMASLAKRFVKDQCRFLYFFSDAKSDLVDQLRDFVGRGSGATGATLLVLNRKRHKLLSLRAALEETPARTFLENVLSGTGNWAPYDDAKLPA